MARRTKSRPVDAVDLPSHAELSRLLETHVEPLAGTEILCGIPSFHNGHTIDNVVRAVEAGIRKHFPGRAAAIVISDGGSTDGTVEKALAATTEPDEDMLLIDPRAPRPKRLAVRYPGISGKGSAFRAIFTIAKLLDVRAVAVFDADLRSITPTWVENLVGPVLHRDHDFVAPVYARHKYDGTITNAIAFPLTSALYGVGLRQPIGGEFGFSGELAAHWSRQGVWGTDVARYGIDIWMTTVALTEGFQVCQAALGAKIHDPKDPGAHLGPMFRQVVGSLFALAGRYVERWWEVDRIVPVRTYGYRAVTTAEEVRVKTGRLTWRFIEGYMRYESLWREVLSIETYKAVTRATDEAADKTEGFVLPADVWANIVYDFLVAYNAGAHDVSHLIDAMIPLYFARTATFVQEASADDQEAAEARIQSFADLFLSQKPYLRARWTGASAAQRTLAEQRVTPEGTEEVEALGKQTA